MFFNEAFGTFPIDAPFDIDRHRVCPYRLPATDAANKSNHKKLSDIATESLREIVSQKPQKPFFSIQQTPDEIRRQRDVANMKWAMATIHIPTIDEMVIGLPRYLNSRVLHFWESFNGVVTNSLFHVYDEEAKAALFSMHKAWHGCVSHGEQYHMANNPNLYVFANPGDRPLDDQQEQEWNAIEAACVSLRESLDRLLEIIRRRFLEIDIDEMNSAAWREYVEFHKEMDKRLER